MNRDSSLNVPLSCAAYLLTPTSWKWGPLNWEIMRGWYSNLWGGICSLDLPIREGVRWRGSHCCALSLYMSVLFCLWRRQTTILWTRLPGTVWRKNTPGMRCKVWAHTELVQVQWGGKKGTELGETNRSCLKCLCAYVPFSPDCYKAKVPCKPAKWLQRHSALAYLIMSALYKYQEVTWFFFCTMIYFHLDAGNYGLILPQIWSTFIKSGQDWALFSI